MIFLRTASACRWTRLARAACATCSLCWRSPLPHFCWCCSVTCRSTCRWATRPVTRPRGRRPWPARFRCWSARTSRAQRPSFSSASPRSSATRSSTSPSRKYCSSSSIPSIRAPIRSSTPYSRQVSDAKRSPPSPSEHDSHDIIIIINIILGIYSQYLTPYVYTYSLLLTIITYGTIQIDSYAVANACTVFSF